MEEDLVNAKEDRTRRGKGMAGEPAGKDVEEATCCSRRKTRSGRAHSSTCFCCNSAQQLRNPRPRYIDTYFIHALRQRAREGPPREVESFMQSVDAKRTHREGPPLGSPASYRFGSMLADRLTFVSLMAQLVLVKKSPPLGFPAPYHFVAVSMKLATMYVGAKTHACRCREVDRPGGSPRASGGMP